MRTNDDMELEAIGLIEELRKIQSTQIFPRLKRISLIEHAIDERSVRKPVMKRSDWVRFKYGNGVINLIPYSAAERLLEKKSGEIVGTEYPEYEKHFVRDPLPGIMGSIEAINLGRPVAIDGTIDEVFLNVRGDLTTYETLRSMDEQEVDEFMRGVE